MKGLIGSIIIISLSLVIPKAAKTADCAQGGAFDSSWRRAVDGFEYIDRSIFSCPKATITAVRFDRRFFELGLLDAIEEQRFVNPKLNKGGVFLNARRQFVRFGANIATVSNVGRESGKLLAIVPASWWLDTDPIEADGYLKIRNKIKSDVFGSQNTLICLNEGVTPGDDVILLYYQRKGVFAISNWPKAKRERLDGGCTHVFQTEPRIVETPFRQDVLSDPANSGNPRIMCLKDQPPKVGICRPANPSAPGLQRVVLLLDLKGRFYLIYFHDEIPFFDIQTILLSKNFYLDTSPDWAVNLAGGERAGIFVEVGNTRFEYGNLESDLPSLLVVRRR